VVARAGAEPLAVVLDEYPYLEGAAPGPTSVLQRFWDHAAPGTQIKLVLSGSYVSAMKRLDDVDQPLHARRTHRMTLAHPSPNAVHLGLSGLWAAFAGIAAHLEFHGPRVSSMAPTFRQDEGADSLTHVT